jgi:UPF0755 protein
MKKNVLFILSALVCMASAYGAFEMLVPPQPGYRNIEVEIPEGATFKKAVQILHDNRLIRDKNIFYLLGRLTKDDRKIRAGFYSIRGDMSPLDILKMLRLGQIIEHEVTVVEGDSLYEIAGKFAEAGISGVDHFMQMAADPDLLAAYDIDAPSAEGYIFPDTYLFPKGIRTENALGIMIDRMRQKYSDELFERTEAMGMTENEVLTLASIIEREAIIDSERPLISSVYHNRLKKNMPLQADPTAVYGIKKSGQRITISDLQRRTDYNTYVIKGLPPGPIASPGLKSIIAALHPADTRYLFFVSLDNFTHRFTATAAEHMKAVQMYREWKESIKNDLEAKVETGEAP